MTWNIYPQYNCTLETKFIKRFEEIYSKIIVTCSKKHDFLGMNLDLSYKGKIWLSMSYGIKGVIESSSKVITGTSENLIESKLFDVHEDWPNIEEEQYMAFHNCISKLLFFQQKSKARHKDRNRVPHHPSKYPKWVWLEETEVHVYLPEWYNIPTTHTTRVLAQCGEMLGGRLLHITPVHAYPLWRVHVPWKRGSILHATQTEDKNEYFN